MYKNDEMTWDFTAQGMLGLSPPLLQMRHSECPFDSELSVYPHCLLGEERTILSVIDLNVISLPSVSPPRALCTIQPPYAIQHCTHPTMHASALTRHPKHTNLLRMHNVQTDRTSFPPPLASLASLPHPFVGYDMCCFGVCSRGCPLHLAAAVTLSFTRMAAAAKGLSVPPPVIPTWEDGGRVSVNPPLTPVSPRVAAVYVYVHVHDLLCYTHVRYTRVH